MARSCQVCGKGFSVGNQVTIRGKAKYLGGVGLKTTSVKKRTFKPNLQTVETVENGTRKRVKASVRAIRAGLVVKPAKRAYTYTRDKRAGA